MARRALALTLITRERHGAVGTASDLLCVSHEFETRQKDPVVLKQETSLSLLSTGLVPGMDSSKIFSISKK